jgi:hypothetical protein
MFWFSRLTEHAGYASQLLGPQLVSSFGLGLVFVPLALVALHNVADQDSGVASSLLNTAQQVGGAIGLAVLGTVAWTTVANSVRTQVGHASAAPPPASIYNHALTVGFSRAFLVAAGIGLLALIIAIATIRVSRQELTGVAPAPQEDVVPAPREGAEPAQREGAEPAPHETVPQPAAPQPGTEQRPEDRVALAAAARPCRLC